MSYSKDSKEQENNSLTKIYLVQSEFRFKFGRQIETIIDSKIDKVNIQSIQC
jgi:hypothetical protein